MGFMLKKPRQFKREIERGDQFDVTCYPAAASPPSPFPFDPSANPSTVLSD
ncbi:hypothetical protein L1049_002598 [Liquidambar formosana]|uniref:Uncharacterized protein n=1 Tax=Liquidambar formosana TaxID=63359 RepID=A0AAP0NHP8_LIQFO